MADTPPAAPKASTSPKIVQMPRTVHELVTGPKVDEKLEPETFLTDDVVKEHKLDSKAIAALVATGAVELVDVHKG